MCSTAQKLAVIAALCLVSLAVAHGENLDDHSADSHMNMLTGAYDGGGIGAASRPEADGESIPTYFALADHSGAMTAHIVTMVVAWVFLLPAAVMLSIARSRYTLVLQAIFLAINIMGISLGVFYNANTPDLYPNNAHHKVGWIAVAVTGAQIMISLLAHAAGTFCHHKVNSKSHLGQHRAFSPLTAASMAERDCSSSSRLMQDHRLSNDSGHGTEANTESIQGQSDTPPDGESPRMSSQNHKEYNGDDDDLEGASIMHMQKPKRATNGLSNIKHLASLIPSRVWVGLMIVYNIVDRIILPFGFATFCLGITAYARFFEGHEIFSGLAHWIKGGVFFWLGIFTLGRWSGSFGDIGWAWNVRPRQKGKWRPSAEFVESFLIFFYGSTNIFLEHLGNTSDEWSAQDLEHVSITVLFIGGGLLGMLIESSCVRKLLNTTVSEAVVETMQSPYDDQEHQHGHDACQAPKQYEFSINPIPALIILLLGVMMSSHTQESMVSSMVHKQWGNLLMGASFARGLTYVLLYLKPPRSVYPSRPPTELLASFGLISGGILFMASSSDTVQGMVNHGLDAMFMYTVTMGMVGLLMAWVITVLAIKGWASRREAAWRRAVR